MDVSRKDKTIQFSTKQRRDIDNWLTFYRNLLIIQANLKPNSYLNLEHISHFLKTSEEVSIGDAKKLIFWLTNFRSLVEKNIVSTKDESIKNFCNELSKDLYGTAGQLKLAVLRE